MKALVIYDSFFGNTEQVAQAVGHTLGAAADVTVSRVTDVTRDQLKGLALLVVGSPTRSFRASPATMEFINDLPAGSLKGIKVAVFDTRLQTADIGSPILRGIVNLGGYAVPRMASGLKQKGGEVLPSTAWFYVTGEQGPLKAGELERAANWANSALCPVLGRGKAAG